MNKRIAIMDIGSNSVRLVIYEQLEGLSHRIVHESKKTARLIEKVDADGRLPVNAIEQLARILNHFLRISRANEASEIRAVATAAVRNAGNTGEITALLKQLTGITVEVASDEDEARYGFIGTINALEIEDGFLIDIGGGSTEITLFRGRRIVNSVSFPFGAVNTAQRFAAGETDDHLTLQGIRTMVERSLSSKEWLSANPGLPLVGLGGTARTAAKLVQRQIGYPLSLTHNFRMSGQDIESVIRHLLKHSVAERSRLDGVSEERADIIVPGLTILQTVYLHTRAAGYIISGAGVREGVYYETVSPNDPYAKDPVEQSIAGLAMRFPSAALPHVRHVDRLAQRIFAGLEQALSLADRERSRTCLHVAALLYRIGTSVSFYAYHGHTFYLIVNARIDGLSHRETVICALAASYKSKKKARKLWQGYRSLLSETDFHTAIALGSLVRLAAALDSGEDQQVKDLEVGVEKQTLHLRLHCSRFPEIELGEAEEQAKDFKKIWGLTPRFDAVVASNT